MPLQLPLVGAAEPSTPLRAVPFTVVDLETTGGSPETCAITEVGAVRVRGGDREAELSTLVCPGTPIPRSITALTGISTTLVADAPPISAVLPMLLEMAHGSVLVAHNARFDVSFLNAALRRHGYATLEHPVVCTATLARRLVRDEVRNCKLATLARHFRTTHEPSHRALPDAQATVEVLHALLERASGLGVTSLGALLELCARRDLAVVSQRHQLADALPERPGVYAFRSASGEVLYVGKAVDLRARVRTYFGGDPRRMVRGLLRETTRIDHRVCATEIEAEVRELRAIARWRPRFNRRLKPPRRAVWVKLTTERFPRLSIVRTVRDDGATYLGPLRSSKEAERIRDAVHDALPLRRCTMTITARTRAPACLLAEIGKCPAPCTGAVDPEAYRSIVDDAREALRDGGGVAAARLLRQMLELGDRGRYEEAAWRRDRLAALTDAVRRARTARALNGVDLVAARPVSATEADVVRVVDGRLSASTRCPTAQVERVATGLAAHPASTGDLDAHPFVVMGERALLHRWLSTAGTRAFTVEGVYAEPVAGGATLLSVTRRLRRRGTRRQGDDLRRKRMPRPTSEGAKRPAAPDAPARIR